MPHIRICPIVEGHGEVDAVRVLLDRTWREIGGTYVEVTRPIRQPKGKLVKPRGIERAVALASNILTTETTTADRDLILVLLDADSDCPGTLGPSLLERARESAGHKDIICVIANVEYETWFVGGVAGLDELLELPAGEGPTDPEGDRQGKGWIEQRWRGAKYSETVDQARLSARFRLDDCRRRCASFDKLCRELELRRG